MRDPPLRVCYPYGGHDIAVEPTAGETAQPLVGRSLNGLVTALFAAAPLCRRVVAAPAEDDTAAQGAFEAGGFRRVTEADLPTGTVVLFTAEPSWLADVPTALTTCPADPTSRPTKTADGTGTMPARRPPAFPTRLRPHASEAAGLKGARRASSGSSRRAATTPPGPPR
ncbi:hypothetical protein [Streptomyces capitiformicae]|uniref:hypothetical protein n=1 Tax=Streptomyces capitiformicae TaxID=2014920 RepID=UPI0016758030|nr:hypothetical protein [Streptomyces capitiformicae]